jgi:hypothetical protein
MYNHFGVVAVSTDSQQNKYSKEQMGNCKYGLLQGTFHTVAVPGRQLIKHSIVFINPRQLTSNLPSSLRCKHFCI